VWCGAGATAIPAHRCFDTTPRGSDRPIAHPTRGHSWSPSMRSENTVGFRLSSLHVMQSRTPPRDQEGGVVPGRQTLGVGTWRGESWVRSGVRTLRCPALGRCTGRATRLFPHCCPRTTSNISQSSLQPPLCTSLVHSTVASPCPSRDVQATSIGPRPQDQRLPSETPSWGHVVLTCKLYRSM
jgi:hypothetical protein